LVSAKGKRKWQTSSLFAANGNGKQMFVFLDRQTKNGNVARPGWSGGGNSSRKTGLFVGQSAVNNSVELPDDRQMIAK
jgi:hypothetical protein